MLLPPMVVLITNQGDKIVETWLRNNEHTIKTLGVLSAAIFTLIQYFGHTHENRVQQTLTLYKEFSSAPLLAARNEILQELEKQQTFFQQIPIKPPSETDADQYRKQWALYVVNRINTNPDLMVQVNNIFDYFDALQICVENNICDKKSAQNLLGVSAKEFMDNFCPYIAFTRYNQNINNEQFATKSNTFSGNACKAEKFKPYFQAP